MTKFISTKEQPLYSLSDAYTSALTGKAVKGFTAEISQTLDKRHGSNGGIRIPLQALMASKATGSSAAIGGAVPLNGYDIEGNITEIDGAIKKELLATKFGVSARSTAQSEFRIPYANSKPSAVIVDLDTAIPDTGGATFDYISVKPVIAGSLIEVANSLDFSNPDAVSVVTNMITSVVQETIDNAFLNGFGPLPSGISFAGLAGVATASGVTLNSASTISAWADVVEAYSSYTNTTNTAGTKWLIHPRTANSLLPTSPIFAGSQTAIALGSGVSPLLGREVVQGRLPVTAGVPDTVQTYFGDPSEIFLTLFDSASISLVANPFEAGVFSRGGSLLRVMVSFGMAVRDPKKLVRALTQLP